MRASPPSTSSPPTALLPIADGKSPGGAANSGAAERSSADASADRNSDPSQDGSSAQLFAAALADVQSDSGRLKGVKSRPIIDVADGKDALQTVEGQNAATSAAVLAQALRDRHATLPPSTQPLSLAQLANTVAAASTPGTEHEAQATTTAAKEDDAGSPTAHKASDGKSKTVKHTDAAASLMDGGTLAVMAALLGTSTAQTGAATSAPASSVRHSAASSASTGSAAAVFSAAARQLLSRGGSADPNGTQGSPGGTTAVAAALRATDGTGLGDDSSSFGRGPDASANGASASSALAPMVQNLNSVSHAISAAAAPGIGVPMSDPKWANALATQVQWMASRQMQSATLRLSPEHLGPLEVRIDVTHSQINVNFSAHHPDTRDALAQAVPRLRELFAAGGLNLGEATVRQEARSGDSSLPQPARPNPAAETVEPVANTAIRRIGLVDEYA